jgi:DNA-binding LacI/PurR family transcriptional regulator
MATMNDVARLAKVSVSTVSYVLTGTRPISQRTRDKVLAAMAELDYQPNAMARGLASRRSTLLGLLLPMDERGLGATETAFVTGAAGAASEAGYHLMLHPAAAADLEALRQLASRRLLEGALLMEVRLDDDRVEVLRELGVPMTLIGRTGMPDGIPYVDIDFDQTVRDAVAHLVELGHRRIVYVNHSPGSIDVGYGPARRTQDAFLSAMNGHGLEPLMIAAEDTAAGGRAAIGSALEQAPDLTAVLAMNESAVFGLLGELSVRGLNVPDDVSVISMVTSPQVAELATPALTTMTSPGSTMGRIAVEVLLNGLNGPTNPSAPNSPSGTNNPSGTNGTSTSGHPVPTTPVGTVHQQLLPCTLEIRGTTGPAKTRPGTERGSPPGS